MDHDSSDTPIEILPQLPQTPMGRSPDLRGWFTDTEIISAWALPTRLYACGLPVYIGLEEEAAREMAESMIKAIRAGLLIVPSQDFFLRLRDLSPDCAFRVELFTRDRPLPSLIVLNPVDE